MDRSDDKKNRLFGLSRDTAHLVASRMKARAAEGVQRAFNPDPLSFLAAEVPERHYRFDQMDGYLELLRGRAIMAKLGLANPFFRCHEGVARDTSTIHGQNCINYATYNYLDLCGHPEVSGAAKAAIDRYGTSASASRIVSGERPVHRELEAAIAANLGVDDSVVFVGGHATNVTTIGHLFGPKDLIIHDALIHNSVALGAALSGARRLSFPHNDVEGLEKTLSKIRHDYERTLIVTEGLFSMDGDIPPLQRLIEIKDRYRAFLMIDEAHSLGVLGTGGHGLAEHVGVDPRAVDIWMGTLSKTLAGCGGYIAGSAALVDYLKFTVPGFVYSVGMPPPMAAASLAALNLMQREPQRVKTLRERASLFLELAKQAGLDTGVSLGYAIVPVITHSSHKAVLLANRLADRRINVQPIVAPAVEEKAARLRFFLSCAHSMEQIRTTVATIVQECLSDTLLESIVRTAGPPI